MADNIFFLPYGVKQETLEAINEEAKSRGMRVSITFSKEIDIVVVINEMVHFKWEVLSYLKSELGLRGYWGGKCVHISWNTDSYSIGRLQFLSPYPYLLCYMHPSLGSCPPRTLQKKKESNTMQHEK